MPQSNTEQLKKIDDKMAQLKAKRQAILNREKENERKARTRRLIQHGALAEKYLQCENIDTPDFELLLSLLVTGQGFLEFLNETKKYAEMEKQRLAANKPPER